MSISGDEKITLELLWLKIENISGEQISVIDLNYYPMTFYSCHCFCIVVSSSL